MTRSKQTGFLLAAVALALGLGFLWGRGRTREAPEAETREGVVAEVKVAPVRKGRLEGRLLAFGSIVAAPGGTRTVSVPYECRIVAVAAREGQPVAKGEALLTVTDSPEALLALDQARIDARSAEVQLAQARGRHDLRLADNAQLAQAQQAADSAQARVRSLEARQQGGSHVLRADAGGVVSRLTAQVGALVPAGTPLAELVDTAKLEARLGLEPQDAGRAAPGSSVLLEAVDGAAPVRARLRSLSPALNPATRLRDAYAALPSGHPFLLGQFVRGALGTGFREGLLVPYAAVLADEGRQVLYVVRKDHAVRIEVRVLAQDGDLLQVAAQDLQPGEPVVVQGNYELQDAMAVRMGEPAR